MDIRSKEDMLKLVSKNENTFLSFLADVKSILKDEDLKIFDRSNRCGFDWSYGHPELTIEIIKCVPYESLNYAVSIELRFSVPVQKSELPYYEVVGKSEVFATGSPSIDFKTDTFRENINGFEKFNFFERFVKFVQNIEEDMCKKIGKSYEIIEKSWIEKIIKLS